MVPYPAGSDRSTTRAVFFAGILLFLLVGCGSPTPVLLPPEEIVSRSADRMRTVSGFHFVIDRTGAPAFLDIDGTLAFRRAEGDFVQPDKTEATIRVITPGLVAEIKVISIGAVQWETNVLSGQWQELPPNWGFNPALLFDGEIGIQPILETDLSELTLSGVEELEEVPGKSFYAIEAVVDGTRLYQLSYGMMGPDVLTIKLWIDPETFDLYRMLITDPVEAGEPTLWQIDFWDFDQVIEISPPISGGG